MYQRHHGKQKKCIKAKSQKEEFGSERVSFSYKMKEATNVDQKILQFQTQLWTS